MRRWFEHITRTSSSVTRTNLMATGWLLSMLVPAQWRLNIAFQNAIRHTEERTLEDNTERALSNLLPNPKVIAHNAIGGTRLRGMMP